MKIIDNLKRILPVKKALELCVIFLLSGTRLYGDVMPFGISAVCVAGKSPAGLLFYFVALLLSDMGFLSFLRHIFALFIYKIGEHFLNGRVPDEIIVGSSVILGGTLSLIAGIESEIFIYTFVLLEALFSAIFVYVFRRAKETVRKRKRGGGITESEITFPVLTAMTLCLSFADVYIGKFSPACILLFFIGMAASYRFKPPVSAVVNMASGLFCYIFTPQNIEAVTYLAVSGFAGAIMKKYGKFAVPASYMAIFPVLIFANTSETMIYLEDIVLASALFIILPAKAFSFLDILQEGEEPSFIKLSEKINIASDTFYSISRIFSGLDLRIFEKEFKDASSVTVETVCRDCALRGKCSENAERKLRAFSENSGKLHENDIACTRKRELLSAFSGNYRVLRMERLWNKHIREESEAVSEQMECIARMLKDMASEKEVQLWRNPTVEHDVRCALKKYGIVAKNVIAGKNGEGFFNVIVDIIPGKNKGVYSDYCGEIINEITGFDMVRCGMENSFSGRVHYIETKGYKIEKAVSKASPGEVSGDSVAFGYVDESHFGIALSDGMGTGAIAGYKSNAASELSLRLLSGGMNLDSALGMVNSLLLRQGGRDFVTLDMAVINLETGEAELSKNAAASSFILKCGGEVITLEGMGSPIGIVGKREGKIKKVRMSEGDFLIMVSDGVTDAFGENVGMLADVIGEYIQGSACNLSDFILNEAIKKSGRKLADDMTVIAVGCIKKQKSGKDNSKGGQVYEKRQKSYYIGQH